MAAVHSVALLSFIVLMALVGLGAAENWPKLLRVGLAFGGYATVLLVGLAFHKSDKSIPYALFAGAGAIAGLISGLVRPAIDPSVVLISVAGGALLLGTVHWAGCRRYEAILRNAAGTNDKHGNLGGTR